MKSMIVFMLLATVSVAGDLRFNTAQPISVDRVGIAGAGLTGWGIVGGDDSFLLVWRDDRHAWPKFVSGGYMATRLGADGTPLDEIPIFLPTYVAAVTRGNDEWIVVGWPNIVRISDEGKITAIKALPQFGIPYVGGGSISGAAWTGQALVVFGSSYSRSSEGPYIGAATAMTLDAELNHVKSTVLSYHPSFTLGVAGDGVSSAMFVYQTRPDEHGVRAAVFDAHGELREDSIFHASADFSPSGAAVAIGPGEYAIAVGADSSEHRRLEVMTLD